jgi:hypothetical protein
MMLTKVLALAALVVLGGFLILAGISHAHPGQVPQHVHSAVYHRSPAPVRPA